MMSENIKRIRKKRKYSVKDLEIKAGITSATIFSLETGRNDNPQIKTLLALANALNVSVDTLIK